MSANSLFSIATSALNSYQFALNITGNNIANVYTPGYNRQVANLTERAGGAVGNGVEVLNVQSVYDNFINSELRSAKSQYSQASTFYDYAYNFNLFLGSESSGVNKTLQSFFDSIQNALSEPDSVSYRSALLNEANQMISRFQSINSRIDNLNLNLNQEISCVVNQINGITSQIANINNQLNNGLGDNLLLIDERENLLQSLSEYISFTSVANGNNINVYLGTGDALVVSSDSSTLVTQLNQDKVSYDIAVEGDYYNAVVTDSISGGSLGGMLDFKNNVLNVSKLEVNRIALVVSDQINKVNSQGLTLNGEQGGLFFYDVNSSALVDSRIYPKQANQGSADFSLSVTDSRQITSSEYLMTLTSSSDYVITRISDEKVVSSGAIAGFPQSIHFDGLELVVQSGTFSSNDQYFLNSLSSYINHMDLQISNVSDIAFASLVHVSNDNSNFGDGNINFLNVTNLNSPSFSQPGQLNPPLAVEFLTDISYQIINTNDNSVVSGPLVFQPGTTNSLFPTATAFDPGYNVTISGYPQSGDKFYIDFNASSVGDNRNGMLMSNLKSAALIEDNLTFQQSYNRFLNTVATRTHFSEITSQSSKIVLDQSQSHRDSVSGVNLDEEAANMLAYQQAYQMSAQLISIADSLFKTILELI